MNMKPINSILRRRTKVPGRVRLVLERLEGRDLPSVSPLALDVPVDPIVGIAETEFAQDNNTLTRTDVINLFNTVAGTKQATFNDGVVSFQKTNNPDLSTPLSAQSVSDLRSIFENSAAWGMSPDVADLAGKVVGYNLANEHYQGNDLISSGQLAAGDPAGALHELVEKWFKGADLPAIGVGDATYQTAKGTLFGPNGPLASDVAQGAAGDCYFLSNLAETAKQAPQDIENMFIDNGNGTYTVRFFEYDSATNTCTPDFVTVNSKLPANSAGQFVYANADFGGQSTNIGDSKNVLWVALAEKAYAQLAEAGWSRAGWSASVNAYSSINVGDNRIAGQQITGSLSAIWVSIRDHDSNQANTTITTLAADFQAGDLITICSDDKKMTVPGLGDNNVYYVTALDVADGTITLTNPYWDHGAKRLTLTLAELADNADGAAVVGT
jgi:hypothetical protein